MRSKSNATWAVSSALAVGVVVLIVAFALARARGVPLGTLTYDSTSVLETPVYVGSISRFNMMMWSAVAAQALLVAILVRALRVPMGFFGAVTLMMAADDALRLHEGVGPRVGVPEMAFYVFYAAVVVGLLVWFAQRWSLAGAAAYLIGAGMLAVSVVTDLLSQDDLGVGDGLVLLEDGSKLLGALVWVTVPALLALEHRRSGASAADDWAGRGTPQGGLRND